MSKKSRRPSTGRAQAVPVEPGKELGQSEYQLRQLVRALEQSPVSVVITDAEGTIEWVNSQFEEITGYSAREAIGQNPRILKAGEHPPEFYRELWDQITRGEVWRGEFHNQKKNGEHYWESASISPIKAPTGVITHFVGVKQDITARKAAERALRQSESRFRDLYDHAPVAYFSVDAGDGTILNCNRAAEDLLGYPAEDLRNTTVFELYGDDPQGMERAKEVFRRFQRGESIRGIELQMKDRDGRPVWIDLWVEPLRDGTGKIVESRSVAVNVTGRRMAEDALAWEAKVNGALAALAKGLISQRSLDEISLVIWEQAKHLTKSSLGYVGYIQPGTGYLVAPTLTREAWENCRVPHKDIVFTQFAGLWGWVLENRKPILVNHLDQDSRSTGTPEGHIPIQSFLSAPAMIEDNLVGQVALANAPRPYSDRDLEVIQRLADIYAIAVQRERAQQALREAKQELEQRVRERTRELNLTCQTLRERIIEQKSTEAALRYSENRYSTVVENSLTGIFMIQDGKLTFVNNRFADICGYTKKELLGMDTLRLSHPDERRWVGEIRSRRLGGQPAPAEYETRLIRKDGQSIWVRRRVTLTEYEGKPAILGNVVDITQRKRAEEELHKSEHELRVLSSKLLNAHEEERKRIALELHDTIAQSLVSIQLALGQKLDQMGEHPPPSGISLENILSMVQSSVGEVRRIMAALRPSILDDLGILSTLEWHCREFQKVHPQIEVKKNIRVQEDQVPEPLKIVIFRILQEAMNNAAKHSGGSLVSVSLHRSNDVLELKVADDGRGFEPNRETITQTGAEGIGLNSMRERTALSNGDFVINSSSGGGTTIRASWHLEA